MEWINLSQYKDTLHAFVNTVMDLWVWYHVGNFSTRWRGTVIFSVVTQLHELVG
jgi:hypothetical protein